MRFLANGPVLPDELLIAQDEGGVLFFCGAGVSRAQAHLPGFLELAEAVLKKLGALPDSPARKLVDVATQLQKEPIEGVGGILAADRIFGLLERDFALSDIERAVGQVLRPKPDVNLEAHRVLLDLSRGPDGNARLVTTNFDLLFEAAARGVPRWTPSDLPDLRRQERFLGVVHLHGMFDEGYTRPVGGNLVLSSAEFGRAYLAEGWATAFIRAAIERYLVVFVGYTADDPPVQYLLEALSRVADDKPRGLYAFQSGRENEARALWRQKGVTAIAYSPEEDHSALWQTLAAWSERARKPARWREKLLRRALRGPEAMLPHERGQVAHLAATVEGARCIEQAKKPIPATWLCAFDPAIRYGTPAAVPLEPGSLETDPFERYRLDSDPQPPKRKESERYKPREVPANVVDVLAPQPVDGPASRVAGLRDGTRGISSLSARLSSLAIWFMRVSGQPAALWWASGQKGFHPGLLSNVQSELDNRENTLSPLARTAWRYLLEAWSGGKPTGLKSYALNARLAHEGWTPSARRELAELLRPVLVADRPYGAVPTVGNARQLNEVVRLDVEYAEEEIPIEIPDGELTAVLPILRRHLEQASALETELGPYGLTNIPPIEPDPNLPGESSDRSYGVNRHILKFAALFKRLADRDPGAASEEFAGWRRDDDPIFARLRIWAAGIPGLLDADQAGQVFVAASDRDFWGFREQRDILLALARRWRELAPATLGSLEARLRRGMPRERHFNRKLYPKWRARSIAERLSWLKAEGCTFSFDVDAEIAAARLIIPEWNPEEAARAADSAEGRGGPVHTDTSFADLQDVPIEGLIEVALASHNRKHGFLQEHDPYAGICEKRPVRVLAALRRTTASADVRVAGWTQFLNGVARADKPRLALLLARRLARLPHATLANLASAAAAWLEASGKRRLEVDAGATWSLFDRLLETVERHPDNGSRFSKGEGEVDWANSSWGSVVGNLTNLLLLDPALSGLRVGDGLPAVWKDRASRLRSLPGDHGRLCLVRLARQLSWLFAIESDWTEATVLSALDSPGADRQALLAGFFHGGGQTDGLLLFRRMKPTFLALSIDANGRDHEEAVLASLLTSAWRLREAGERWLSDEDLRTVLVHGSANMRARALWRIGQWKEIDDKLVLLKEAWPLQLAARGYSVTRALCALAFRDEENFPALVEAILPLVSPREDGVPALPHGAESNGKIFDRYPGHVLALLAAVLPIEGSKFPYGTHAALERLCAVSKGIAKDARMIELRRRLARSHHTT